MDINNARVSIGLPVYNGELYLEKALVSIKQQTYEDFELIISDNASTDRTQQICQDFASQDKRIRYYRNTENIGGGNNFNKVVYLAQTEFFKWAAHDDWCSPEFIQKCVYTLDQNKDVVLCYPGTILIDQSDNEFGLYKDGLHLMQSAAHLRLKQFFATQGLCHAIYGVIRLAPLKTTKLEGNFSRADRVLLMELTLRGKFFELNDYLFYRRIHPEISTNVAKTESELAAWYLHSLKGKRLFPKWRRLLEYHKAIYSSPIGFREKFLCQLQILKFVTDPIRVRNMASELASPSK